MPFPCFRNFTKISSPFFQCAMCSSIESLEKLERLGESPTIAEVVTQIQEEVSPRETGTSSLPFPFSLLPLSYASPYFMTLLILQMLIWAPRNPSL